jgi:hypothetical protein
MKNTLFLSALLLAAVSATAQDAQAELETSLENSITAQDAVLAFVYKHFTENVTSEFIEKMRTAAKNKNVEGLDLTPEQTTELLAIELVVEQAA